VSGEPGAPAEETRGLRPPPGAAEMPPYARGWLTAARGHSSSTEADGHPSPAGIPGSAGAPGLAGALGSASEGESLPYLSYVAAEQPVNWSEDLEELHEESSRTHFIDVWTRRAMLGRLGPLPPAPTLVDLGCSTGYLLEDLRALTPHATLLGVDLVAGGLRKAHALVPDARLLQADVCRLPLEDGSVDAAVSANLLEHVPDDERALAEIGRILRPGARAVIVVPLGPHNYDYYDRFLGHERRYARGELARKARLAGLSVLEDLCLGAPLYPAFWAVKQRNRRRHDHLRGRALAQRVARDIERTNDSPLGGWACRLEEALLGAGVRLPFGIRGLTVLARR
jgi:SAM-dependent methyltransferase